MTTVADLQKYDIYFLLDKSGSMGQKDSSTGNKTRWEVAQETVVALARKAAEFDEDGITVVPFSAKRPDGKFEEFDKVTEVKVSEVFAKVQPNGGTDTAGALKQVTDDYFAKKAANPSETKPRIIIILTDGVPDDKDALRDVIVKTTKKMDRDEEIGILFVQAGNDTSATKTLKEYDDDLVGKYGAKFDIVDTKTADELGSMPDLAQALIAALDD